MTPTLLAADELFSGDPPNLSDSRCLLAEGDSWFTVGELVGLPPTNLLRELQVTRRTTIVSAAYPGDTLQHMVDGFNDLRFDQLLRHPTLSRWWTALLVSAGGNDLIDSAGQRPLHRDGTPAAPAERLFLTAAEVAAGPPSAGPVRWISEPGWSLLSGYLIGSLQTLVQRRDDGPSRGRPLLLHTYSVPTVWARGVPLLAPQGWLHPALVAYGVPVAERQPVAALLFERLRALWLSADADHGSQPLPQVHVFDSAGLVTLDAPDPSAKGSSGDWANEIHPNRAGYRKLGRAMGAWLEAVLARYA